MGPPRVVPPKRGFGFRRGSGAPWQDAACLRGLDGQEIFHVVSLLFWANRRGQNPLNQTDARIIAAAIPRSWAHDLTLQARVQLRGESGLPDSGFESGCLLLYGACL